MGTSATNAKNKYNKKAYKKIQIYLKPNVYDAYDNYCKTNNFSKNGLITQFVETLLNK